ncbi:PHD finger protein 14 [Choanephora cucurbitarum]|uniref:PHD finger protein 14 n=1 Tax=Choanephora cucurbitarum TaxID=101091 RepID=A0A1C7NLZ1_9FUNG|nr:PHD finger protein 14 [Choanephora cucurbitarum]
MSYTGRGAPLNWDSTSSTLLMPLELTPSQLPTTASNQSQSFIENGSSSAPSQSTTAKPLLLMPSESPSAKSPEIVTHTSNVDPQKYAVPDRSTSFEKIKNLGRFVYTWRFRHAPSACCICFDDNSAEPIESCDNLLCDVRLHSSCYQKIKKTTRARIHRRWLCDKCTYLESSSLTVVCALCPSTAGLFCMINPNHYSIFWVHYNCAKAFLGEEAIVYKPDLGHFDIKIDSISLVNFEQPCSDCAKSSYSRYGAKIVCRICRTYHHITCIEQYNLKIPDEPYECPDHGSARPRGSEILRRRRLATSYHRWIGKKNHFLLEEFKKVPRMFGLDYWKSLNLDTLSMGDVTEWYKKSVYIIQTNETYPVANTYYNQWVDYVLSLAMSAYSSYEIGNSKLMFTTKHFDEDIGYDFKIPDGAIISESGESSSAQRLAEQTFMTQLTAIQPENTQSDKIQPQKTQPKRIQPKNAQSESTQSEQTQPTKTGTESAQLSTTDPTVKEPVATRSTIARSAATRTSSRQSSPSSNTSVSRKSRNTHLPPAVTPSDDLICAICLQHDLSEAVWERHGLDSEYKENLERTKHKRQPGFTGSGNNWDPRVFIQCCKCDVTVHCGCPVPPIKSYPQRFRVFICIRCDTKQDETTIEQEPTGVRRTNVVNYKE